MHVTSTSRNTRWSTKTQSHREHQQCDTSGIWIPHSDVPFFVALCNFSLSQALLAHAGTSGPAFSEFMHILCMVLVLVTCATAAQQLRSEHGSPSSVDQHQWWFALLPSLPHLWRSAKSLTTIEFIAKGTTLTHLLRALAVYDTQFPDWETLRQTIGNAQGAMTFIHCYNLNVWHRGREVRFLALAMMEGHGLRCVFAALDDWANPFKARNGTNLLGFGMLGMFLRTSKYNQNELWQSWVLPLVVCDRAAQRQLWLLFLFDASLLRRVEEVQALGRSQHARTIKYQIFPITSQNTISAKMITNRTFLFSNSLKP